MSPFGLDQVKFGDGDLGLHIIGPDGSRKRITESGQNSISFLRENRVEVVLPPEDLIGKEGMILETNDTVRWSGRIDQQDYTVNCPTYPGKPGMKFRVTEIRGSDIHTEEL